MMRHSAMCGPIQGAGPALFQHPPERLGTTVGMEPCHRLPSTAHGALPAAPPGGEEAKSCHPSTWTLTSPRRSVPGPSRSADRAPSLGFPSGAAAVQATLRPGRSPRCTTRTSSSSSSTKVSSNRSSDQSRAARRLRSTCAAPTRGPRVSSSPPSSSTTRSIGATSATSRSIATGSGSRTVASPAPSNAEPGSDGRCRGWCGSSGSGPRCATSTPPGWRCPVPSPAPATPC